MTNLNTEEKLRKLAPLGDRKADLAWLYYLSGEGNERQEADDLLDILLYQKAKKDYRERIFLDPPSPASYFGAYGLGTVNYPPGEWLRASARLSSTLYS